MARRYPTRETHRLEILRALEERTLDRDLFEQVMADVLRDSYPTLVPVAGGSDHGQDGVGVGEDGEAFSLIVTTAIDARRNLKDSLEQAIRHGKPRKVVLVTSRSLTPRKRKNYEELAVERGFQLLQIVDRDGVANHLLHRSDRSRELLGLSGRPKALSTVPRTRRPQLDVPLLGRDGDLAWLRERAGELGEDCVVAGEPGSGKTYLLSKLVDEEDGWFFLVDEDREAVANALRDLNPRVVIVDDAHRRLGLDAIELLNHRRDETGQQFAIVATTWKSGKNAVRQALRAVSDDQVRSLELLTRRELQTLFESLQLEANEDQLRELINQSANKPGLAVTLGLIWRRGGREAREKLWKGEALFDLLAPLIEELLGGARLVPLAALALAGETGLELEEVASAINESVAQLDDEASRLSAAGILSERGEGRMAIEPRAFRAPLIGRVFFATDGPRLRLEPFLEVITDREAMVRGLLEARAHDVPVPDELLLAQLKDLPSARLWRDFAVLGPRPARWAIDEFPATLDRAAEAEALEPRMALLAGLLEMEDEASRQAARQGRIIQVTAGALDSAPELAVKRLLGHGPEMADKVLEELRRWVSDLWTLPSDRLERRTILAQAAVRYLEQQGDRGFGAEALALVFSPGLSSTSSDPAVGNRLTWSQSLIEPDELLELEELWTSLVGRLQQALGSLEGESWRPLHGSLLDLLRPWMGNSTEVWHQAARSLVSTMVRDLESMADGRLGIQYELAEIGRQVGVEIEHPRDDVFELLTAAEREKFTGEFEQIVEEWLSSSPVVVVERIQELVNAANQTALGSALQTRLHEIVRQIAGKTKQPTAWLEALEGTESWSLSGWYLGLTSWFLERVVEDRVVGWQEHLFTALDKPAVQVRAAKLVLDLRWEDAEPFLDRAIDVAVERHFPVIEEATLGGVDPEVSTHLLSHPEPAVFGAAVVGEWLSPEPGAVRGQIEADWAAAVLRLSPAEWDGLFDDHGREAHAFLRILRTRSDLALQWLVRHRDRLTEIHICRAAIQALGEDQRRRFIESLDGELSSELVRELIGRDPALYRLLLDSGLAGARQLAPLVGPPDAAWRELAKMALVDGHESDKVARALFADGYSYIGTGLGYWQTWQADLEAHAQDSDRRIRRVIKKALEYVQKRVEAAESEERNTERHGLG